jgi:hypothetical protein
VYQSHTGRLTGLWFLPKLAQGLNTNNNNKMRVFILSITFSKERLILGWIQRNIINVRRFSSEVPVILVRFDSNLIFPDRFSNHPQILNFVYVRPDGHTWLN